MNSIPKSRRSGDRLITPDAGKQITQIDVILARLDRVRAAMDARYGTDQLPACWPLTPPADVPADKREAWTSVPARYGAAVHALNEAIGNDDVAATQAAAERVERALTMMDQQLASRGLIPASPFICEVEADGMQFGIIRDGFDWKRAAEARPDLAIRTAREVAVALAAMDGGLVSRAREAFPGAEVVASRPATATANEDLNDEILF